MKSKTPNSTHIETWHDKLLSQVRYLVLALFVVTVSTYSAEAQSLPDVEQIRRDWMDREARTHSVKYTLSGTAFRPKGKILPLGTEELESGEPAQPIQDHSSPFKATIEWDFERILFRKIIHHEIFYVTQRAFLPMLDTFAVNDKGRQSLLQSNKPLAAVDESDSPVLTFQGDYETSGAFEEGDYAITLAHGMFPNEQWSFNDDRRKLSAKELQLRIVGQTEFKGRPCVILNVGGGPLGEALRIDRLWVDIARKSSIVKWERYYTVVRQNQKTDRLFCRLEIDYQEKPFGWLPLQWSADFFFFSPNDSEEISERHTTHVDEVVINSELLKSDCTIPWQAGYIIRGYEGQSGDFKVAEDGKTLIPIDRRVRTANQAETLWYITTSVLLTIGVGCLRALWGLW